MPIHFEEWRSFKLMNICGRSSWLHAALSLIPLALTLSGAENVPTTLEVRTLTPLSSRRASVRDQPIEATLIKPLLRGDEVLMPPHSRLIGRISRAQGVGVGIRRERSSLHVEFTHWKTPAGELFPLDTKLLRIDNAREQVDAHGRIQGILAASNPLGLARGLWYQPGAQLFRAPAGLAGSSGTAFAKLALGPEGAAALLVARLLLTTLPEPEIDLPAGTEMTLHLSCDTLERSWGVISPPVPLDSALAEFLEEQPTQVLNVGKKPVADIINVALVGSAATIEQSFRAAGWTGADQLNRKSFGRAYTAFTQRRGYAEAPVSKLYYQGRLPDLVFQKSLNSIAKRHHIRLWRVESPTGEEVWLGAATHDITVGFDRKTFGLLHKIDLNIDLERGKVVNDLDFTGATRGSAYITRTLAAQSQAQTDGALAVAFLQPPSSTIDLVGSQSSKPSAAYRFARRITLETRQYVFRDNPYYIAFVAGKRMFHQPEKQTLSFQDAADANRSSCPVASVLDRLGPVAQGVPNHTRSPESE
jgi:hypothetical protein